MKRALPPCPSGKKGQHALNAIIPSSDDNPVLLFCHHCGANLRLAVDLPKPIDDLPSDAIERIAKR